jgi:hypothetical protein
MSRAFVKEDVDVPEPEQVYEFRAYWGTGRFELEPVVVYSSPYLTDVLRWAEGQLGYYQIRDSAGKMLAEVDTALVMGQGTHGQ